LNDETPKEAPHPFPRSVEAFEEVLKRAHDATIAAFAVLTIDPAGIVKWTWHFGARPQTDLIGGLECMRWTIVTKAMQPVEPPPPIPDPPTNVRQ
jgi:hypothetical protein